MQRLYNDHGGGGREESSWGRGFVRAVSVRFRYLGQHPLRFAVFGPHYAPVSEAFHTGKVVMTLMNIICLGKLMCGALSD